MSIQEKRRSGVFVILILAAIFAALIGLYYLIGYLTDQPETEESESVIPSLSGINSEQIDSFSYEYDGTYQTFLKTDNGWIYADDAEVTLNQDTVEGMLSQLCDLKYEKVIADSLTSSSDYGFGQPTNTIVIGFADETQKILYLGSENPMTGVYYAITEGDDHIYAVSPQVAQIFLPVEQMKVSDETDEDTGASEDTTKAQDSE